jgi:hypothetical protein
MAGLPNAVIDQGFLEAKWKLSNWASGCRRAELLLALKTSLEAIAKGSADATNIAQAAFQSYDHTQAG